MEKAAGRSVPSVVDQFCGVGGLAYEFVKAGIRVAAGIDTDESRRCAFEASARSRSVCRSVEDIYSHELARLYVDCSRRVLVKCAPCRSLSSYHKSRAADPEWSLPSAFMRIMRGTCPRVASMKGVPSLCPHAVSEKFVGRLGGEGSRVWHGVASCTKHGVSLTRRRFVPPASGPGDTGIIAWLRGGGLRAVRDATGDLEPMWAGCLSSGNPLRRPRGLSSANPARKSQAQPRGGRMDREMRLVLSYNGKKKGKPHYGVHGQMPWDLPSPTLATQATTWETLRSSHPEQDGGPSLGVAMPIWTLLRGCRFADEKPHMRSGKTAKHMENAVPVVLGKAIALNIKRHLVDHDGRV